MAESNKTRGERVENLQERLDQEIARRKQLEQELRECDANLKEAEAKAEEMTRLKSSLLTNMSHELRTPLTSMLAHASILERKLDGDALSSARAIRRGGKRLTETLDAVLTLAQLEGKALAPVCEDVDLGALLAEIVEPFHPQAEEKGLWLRVDLDDTLLVHNDRRCVERILNNLIGNAIKFTPDGGVSVSVRAEDDLVLEVRDTGVGMNEDFLADLFKPFTQESSGLTRTHEGTGLGLAITHHLIEALAGDIAVESEPGVGTTFTVRLPCKKITSKAAASAGTTQPSAPDTPGFVERESASMSVLLVEDNRDIRRVLEDLLESLGEIVVCPDAESALDLARRRPFEVILMDISLPKMSGVQALEQLREMDLHRDTPVIAMTGHALPGDREQLLDLGFTDYIGKPFSPSALISVLRRRVAS